jgi:hypothetical protein
MNQPREPHSLEQSPQPPQEPDPRIDPIPARPGYPVTGPPGPFPPPGPPKVVRWSYWLWMASFTVGLLAIGYSVSRFDQLHTLLADKVRAQRPEIGTELLNRVVDMTLAIGLGGATGIIVVQLLLAVLMRTRRNWARVLLATVAVLGLLTMAFSLVTIDERAQWALPLQALLVVASTVLMFLPAANAWFRRRSPSAVPHA